MQPTNQKRYSSPQFSPLAAISVRRLAWAMGVSMPATVDLMVRLMPLVVTSSKVCQACKDKAKCQDCAFNKAISQQEKETLSRFSSKEQDALQAVM